MPFYEYECQACKFYTEVMQKISDTPLTKCPSCGKRSLKKLVSAPVFRLKGAGWYETDFKSEKENKRNLAGAEKEESKADTKPEAAPDKKPAEAGKDAKTSDTKPSEPKPAVAKGAAGGTARSARPRASRPAKAKARRPAKSRKRR